MQDVRSTTTKTMRARWALLAMLLGMAPASVLAKDICVQESVSGAVTARYVFSKVRTLRPGRVVALAGARVPPVFPNAEPVDGSAVMLPTERSTSACWSTA